MTNISLMPARPPYVRFEQRPEEDRAASIAAGGTIMRDVDYVVVQQMGSRDTHEKVASEWLSDMERQVVNGLFPAEWLDHFKQKYRAYKEGQDTPELGMPIRQWPSVSKAQAENLIAAGCRTVEDLAAANEQTLQRAGMGSRELQNKARAYMQSRDTNKAAEEITALRAELGNRDTTIAALEERLARLERESKKRA